MNDRRGQVWVGNEAGQSVVLLLWRDDLVDEDGFSAEKHMALDLMTGKISHFITRGLESDSSWVRYS